MARNYKRICRSCGAIISGSWSAGTDVPDEVTYGVCEYCEGAQRKRDKDLRTLTDAARRQESAAARLPRVASRQPADPRANRLKVTGLAIIVGYSWCSAKFTGDYEAVEDAKAYHEPSRVAEGCEGYSEGDNIDCVEVDGDCETRDEIDGRWVHVEVSSIFGDDEVCWIRYDDVTFQHGAFASIWYATLGTPNDTRAINDQVQGEFLGAFAEEVLELVAAGEFTKVVELEEKYAMLDLHYSSETLGHFGQARQQVAYAEGIVKAEEMATTSPDEALELIAELAKQQFPESKPELEELLAVAETTHFKQKIEYVTQTRDFVIAAETLAEVSKQTHPADKSALREPTIALLVRLEAAVEKRRIEPAEASSIVEATGALLGAAELLATVAPDEPARQELEGRIREVSVAGQTALYLSGVHEAKRLAVSKAEGAAKLVCKLRQSEVPREKPELDQLDARVNKRIAAHVKKRAAAYLRSISGRKYKAWRTFERKDLGAGEAHPDDFKDAKEKWLADHAGLDPKKTKSKPGEVTVSDCGSKAVVTINPRASDSEAAPVSLPMCFDDDERKWFPCGPLAAP